MIPIPVLVIGSIFFIVAGTYFFYLSFVRDQLRREYRLFSELGYNVGQNEQKPNFALALAHYKETVERFIDTNSWVNVADFDKLWKKFADTWHDEVLRTGDRPTLNRVIHLTRQQLREDEGWMLGDLDYIWIPLNNHYSTDALGVTL